MLRWGIKSSAFDWIRHLKFGFLFLPAMLFLLQLLSLVQTAVIGKWHLKSSPVGIRRRAFAGPCGRGRTHDRCAPSSTHLWLSHVSTETHGRRLTRRTVPRRDAQTTRDGPGRWLGTCLSSHLVLNKLKFNRDP